MEFLWAFLILVGFWVLTTVLSASLGFLIPIIYLFLGFLLGMESIVIGIGGLLGNVINFISTNKYINTHGAMSHAPVQSRRASIAFILVFIFTMTIRLIYNLEIKNINYWYFVPLLIIVLALRIFSVKNRNNSLDSFYDSVIKYKIVEKYKDDPKWATYLFFKHGNEGWNETIEGSFLAKHPKNDLTFVHNTKEKAIQYAEDVFENAENITD